MKAVLNELVSFIVPPASLYYQTLLKSFMYNSSQNDGLGYDTHKSFLLCDTTYSASWAAISVATLLYKLIRSWISWSKANNIKPEEYDKLSAMKENVFFFSPEVLSSCWPENPTTPGPARNVKAADGYNCYY